MEVILIIFEQINAIFVKCVFHEELLSAKLFPGGETTLALRKLLPCVMRENSFYILGGLHYSLTWHV